MPTVSRYHLPPNDERTALREGIVKALQAVPTQFSSPINLEGLPVQDLFALNTFLGGAIENQTVATLNSSRSIWDPDNRWASYRFNRYAESFPDVRLEQEGSDQPIIGIELKGWYMLAKEEVPSFRFRASADAMTIWDLLVVFPWSLSNVISGTPVLSPPFIEQAKYAADLRTYYWEHRTPNAQPVEHPKTNPYPALGSAYLDIVHDDRGGNFGRIARVQGLMDDWVKEVMRKQLAGVEARWWVRFLSMFDERGTEETIRARLEALIADFAKTHDKVWEDELLYHIKAILQM